MRDCAIVDAYSVYRQLAKLRKNPYGIIPSNLPNVAGMNRSDITGRFWLQQKACPYGLIYENDRRLLLIQGPNSDDSRITDPEMTYPVWGMIPKYQP